MWSQSQDDFSCASHLFILIGNVFISFAIVLSSAHAVSAPKSPDTTNAHPLFASPHNWQSATTLMPLTKKLI